MVIWTGDPDTNPKMLKIDAEWPQILHTYMEIYIFILGLHCKSTKLGCLASIKIFPLTVFYTFVLYSIIHHAVSLFPWFLMLYIITSESRGLTSPHCFPWVEENPWKHVTNRCLNISKTALLSIAVMYWLIY